MNTATRIVIAKIAGRRAREDTALSAVHAGRRGPARGRRARGHARRPSRTPQPRRECSSLDGRARSVDSRRLRRSCRKPGAVSTSGSPTCSPRSPVPRCSSAWTRPRSRAGCSSTRCARSAHPGTDAVLGPALDGGWWAIGLRRADPRVFIGVPMSTDHTFVDQVHRLRCARSAHGAPPDGARLRHLRRRAARSRPTFPTRAWPHARHDRRRERSRRAMRVPNADELFRSPVHDERVAARLGLALGVAFTICFLTGLYSHLAQHPSLGFQLPARPGRLCTASPRVYTSQPVSRRFRCCSPSCGPFTRSCSSGRRSRGVAQLIERLMIFPLVAGSIFMLFTGLANINLWYPWRFNFPDTHFRTAWIVMGALVVHIGAKITVSEARARTRIRTTRWHRRQLRREQPPGVPVYCVRCERARHGSSPSARPCGRWRGFALLAPRRPDTGPQGFPVNATAHEAGVVTLAQDPDYRLTITGRVQRELTFTLDGAARASATFGDAADLVRRGLERVAPVDRSRAYATCSHAPVRGPAPPFASSRSSRSAATACQNSIVRKPTIPTRCWPCR